MMSNHKPNKSLKKRIYEAITGTTKKGGTYSQNNEENKVSGKSGLPRPSCFYRLDLDQDLLDAIQSGHL